MSKHQIVLESWPRTARFHWFRGYQRPHYAVAVWLDATSLMETRKPRDISVYCARLHAIGCGLHAVPEPCMRFRGDWVEGMTGWRYPAPQAASSSPACWRAQSVA